MLFDYTDTYSKRLLDVTSYFRKKNDAVAIDYLGLKAACNFIAAGDYVTALNSSLDALQRFKKRKDSYGLMNATAVVGLSFENSKDYESAISYYKKLIPLGEINEDTHSLLIAFNNLSSVFGSQVFAVHLLTCI